MKTLLLLLLLSASALAAPLVIDTCASYVVTNNVLTCGGVTPPPVVVDPPPVVIPPPVVTPPPGGYANCTAQGLTVIGNATIPWGAAGSGPSPSSFGDNVVWLFAMTVPAGQPPTANQGQFQVAEYQGQPTQRFLTLSKTPCDFRRTPDASGLYGPIAMSVNGTTAGIQFQVGPVVTVNDFGRMQPGTTYYFSVKNWSDFPLPNGSNSCGQRDCHATYNEQPTH